MLSALERLRIQREILINNELVRRKSEIANSFVAYDRQMDFYANSKFYTEVCLMAGNQCLTYDTLVDTAAGKKSIGSLCEKGEPFEVGSWDEGNKERIVTTALPPFKKPLKAQCIRFELSNGEHFKCSEDHRILTAVGWVSAKYLALPFGQNLLLSSSELSRSTHASDVLRLFEILEGCLDDYWFSPHQYDEQLPSGEETGQAFFPSPDDVQQHILPGWREDGQGCTSTHIHKQLNVLLSNQDEVLHVWGQCLKYLNSTSCTSSLSLKRKLQTFQKLFSVCKQALLLKKQDPLYQSLFVSSGKASFIDGNYIVSHKPIGVHDVYDFTVPKTHCYFSGGLIHHNTGKTLSACFEIYCHVTGKYPDWWPGVKFIKAPALWVCGETGEVIRDTTQKYMFGRPGELDDVNNPDYTGMIPRRFIVNTKKTSGGSGAMDYAIIKHATGKRSYIFFKGYSKGREKFQGDTIDGIFFDEEPPEDIYSEGLTRTNKGQLGRFAKLTFTPLKGMSNVVFSFIENPSPAQTVVNMTIQDVDHYTEEEKTAIVAGYPEHEREARSKGIPIMGSGRVYPIAEERIKEKRIEKIPRWWRQLGGLDFGIDHPMAAVKILHDPDTDCIHIRSIFREKDMTPLLFAPAIKNWGVEFAWPHDGLQRDKGSGLQLAAQFRDAGVDMLHERATFEDGSNGVGAGISEILDRMKSGRLKVDENLSEWWEEFRLYHRKNGVIVGVRDDLMDAMRYAVMMLRYAVEVRTQQTSEDLIPEEVNDW